MPAPLPPADLATLSLADLERRVAAQSVPPVADWNPTHCGDSAMRIARDGTWYHEGAPITRPAMVRLFSTILRREPDGGYVLVTPVEKLTILVEDAPFVAVELRVEGGGRDATLAFRLNTDDLLIADAAHPLRFAETANGPHPYLLVRPGLEALVTRNVYYELMALALEIDDAAPGLWSAGQFFPIDPAA